MFTVRIRGVEALVMGKKWRNQRDKWALSWVGANN